MTTVSYFFSVLASNYLKNELENQQNEINLIQLDIDEIKTLIAKIGDQTIKIQRLPLQDGADFNITLNKMPGTNMDDLSEIEMNMEFRNEEDLPEIIQSHLKVSIMTMWNHKTNLLFSFVALVFVSC